MDEYKDGWIDYDILIDILMDRLMTTQMDRQIIKQIYIKMDEYVDRIEIDRIDIDDKIQIDRKIDV